MNYSKDFKRVGAKALRYDEPLSRHTTFKIGGPADAWVEPRSVVHLQKVVQAAHHEGVPMFVIGNGSNLLIRDGGVRGIVIRLSSSAFTTVKVRGCLVTVGAGAQLSRLIQYTKNKGLSGCEFFTGIPGTVGGALIGNAGASWTGNGVYRDGISIGDFVEYVTVFDRKGRKRILKKKDLKFRYRRSNLSAYIILSVSLQLKSEKKSVIEKRIKDIFAYRRATQAVRQPNAGCIFKNPVVGRGRRRISAGRLIDACGLKGRGIGGASVSAGHANYIVNDGTARAADIVRLIHVIQKYVKRRFSVTLEPEVTIVGEK